MENQPYNSSFSVVNFFGSLTDRHAYVANAPSGWTSLDFGVSFIVKGQPVPRLVLLSIKTKLLHVIPGEEQSKVSHLRKML